MRGRYERRESRQEDLTIISDLKQVIAEQEKDLACLNEEKRYFQIKLMHLEQFLQEHGLLDNENSNEQTTLNNSSLSLSTCANNVSVGQNNNFSIPPTIPECEEEK